MKFINTDTDMRPGMGVIVDPPYIHTRGSSPQPYGRILSICEGAGQLTVGMRVPEGEARVTVFRHEVHLDPQWYEGRF